MNNNPHNFKPGDKVQLDEGFANTSIVRIISMTPQMLYSRVVPAELENPKDDDAWDTMTDRLSPLKEEKIQVFKVVNMGMELERWSYKGCVADFGVGEEDGHTFATLYYVESETKRKGYATSILAIAKKHYEAQGRKFGGTVALNDGMRRIYKKLNIEEYA